MHRLCDLGLIISIHSLRVEGDIKQMPSVCPWSAFQSTPSVWRETVFPQRPLHGSPDISIHSLRVEGDTLPVIGI